MAKIKTLENYQILVRIRSIWNWWIAHGNGNKLGGSTEWKVFSNENRTNCSHVQGPESQKGCAK